MQTGTQSLDHPTGAACADPEETIIQQKKDDLWDLCQKYIDSHNIDCAEATANDRVYEHAPDFLESIADIVGYKPFDDEA